jgi:uncharacterized Zn finger protein
MAASQLIQRRVRKALRLRASGGVDEIHAGRIFRVRGDHGTYLVVVTETAECTCPAVGTCAHITAALLEIRATDAAQPSDVQAAFEDGRRVVRDALESGAVVSVAGARAE